MGEGETGPGRVEHAAALREAASAPSATDAAARVMAGAGRDVRGRHAVLAGVVRRRRPDRPAADRLVVRHGAVDEGERAARVVDPAAGGVTAILTVRRGADAGHAVGPIGAGGPEGLVVLDEDPRERDVPAGVEQAAALRVAPALDGQLRERRVAAQDLEHPVQSVAVDDGSGVPAARDRDVAPDVEVAGRGGVLAGPGDCEPEGAVGQEDRVGAGPGVGRHDRRPQRDVALRVRAGLEVHRHRVQQRIDPEDRGRLPDLE